MEAAAEVRGVGKGLELAEGDRLWLTFKAQKPFAADFGEPGALTLEAAGLASQGDCGFCEGGEIDVGGDVDLAGGAERVLGGAVFEKGAEGAGFPSGIVVFRAGEAIVEPEEKARSKAAGEGCEEIRELGADFGAVACGEIGSQRSEVSQQLGVVDVVVVFPNEMAAGIGVDSAFPPAIRVPLDDVKWQCVEQFIAEGDARAGIGSEFVGGADEAGVLWKSAEGFSLVCL